MSAPSGLYFELSAKLSAGTVNYVLTSGGAGVAPSWAVRGATGATGAGGDTVFQENSVVVTTNYTLTTAKNASMVELQSLCRVAQGG